MFLVLCKKWKLIIYIGCGLLCACNPLKIKPENQVDDLSFWENAQLARAYVNDFYAWPLATEMNAFQSEQWSDNSIGNLDGDQNLFRQTEITRRQYDETRLLTVFTVPWETYFNRIHAVNRGIEKVSGSHVLSKKQQKQFLGECYFFRAWTYFEMELYWGALPYVDHTLTVEDETMIPRSTREEIFDYILSDLEISADLFAGSGGYPELGMVTEAAVIAFKSRVALYAACAAEASLKGLYSSGNNEETRRLFTFIKQPVVYYQMAYEAAGSLLGKFSLEEEYGDLFNKEAGYLSKEAIWSRMYSNSQINGYKFNPAAYNGPSGYYYGGSEQFAPMWGVRGSAFPTQDLVDCYYQQDEADGRWKPWWKTSQVETNLRGQMSEDGGFSGEGKDYRSIYARRDKRFYATVLYDGSHYGGNNPMHEIQVWTDTTTRDDVFKYSALHSGFRHTRKLEIPGGKESMYTITGYYPCKYMPGRINEDGTLNTTQTTTTLFMIRYAEVLLNYAEAAIKLDRPEEAAGPLNQIRNRAGMDDFDAGISGHSLWEEYKLQRRLEFAFEIPGQRYFDLLRWNEAEGNREIVELNRGPKGIQIFRKGKESLLLGENGLAADAGEKGYFVPKFRTLRYSYSSYKKKFDHERYYFYPFPQSTLQSYKGLTQNPGWSGFRTN